MWSTAGEEHNTTWMPEDEQNRTESVLEDRREQKHGTRFSGNGPLGSQPLGVTPRGGKLGEHFLEKSVLSHHTPPPVPGKGLEHCPDKAACVNGANVCLAVCFLLLPLISKSCLFSLLIILIPPKQSMREKERDRETERERERAFRLNQCKTCTAEVMLLRMQRFRINI